jgi:hypothetical protein
MVVVVGAGCALDRLDSVRLHPRCIASWAWPRYNLTSDPVDTLQQPHTVSARRTTNDDDNSHRLRQNTSPGRLYAGESTLHTPATAVNGRDYHRPLARPFPELTRPESWPRPDDGEEKPTPRPAAITQGRAQSLRQQWHYQAEAVQEPQRYANGIKCLSCDDKNIGLLMLTRSPGCITCKTKRLKCDETKPTCQQCAKRSVTCGGYKKDFKWRPFEEATFAGKPGLKTKKGWWTSDPDIPCLTALQCLRRL